MRHAPNPRPFNDRNRRSQNGAPICNNCNRRGHTTYNCYQRSNADPRDPRIPTSRPSYSTNSQRSNNPTIAPSFPSYSRDSHLGN